MQYKLAFDLLNPSTIGKCKHFGVSLSFPLPISKYHMTTDTHVQHKSSGALAKQSLSLNACHQKFPRFAQSFFEGLLIVAVFAPLSLHMYHKER